jgi:hypothetical protein
MSVSDQPLDLARNFRRMPRVDPLNAHSKMPSVKSSA